MRLVFGDGTRETVVAGEPIKVLVGSSLQVGSEQALTPEEIQQHILEQPAKGAQGVFVRMLRPTRNGGRVPRVVHSVED